MLIWEYYSNLSIDLNNPSQNLSFFASDIDKLILNLYGNLRDQEELIQAWKKLKLGDLYFPIQNLTQNYQDLKVIKTAWYYHTYRSME